jgi:hypothetical protein
MKIYLLLILFTLLGLSFGEDPKCFFCAFDEDDIEKDCAVNPTKNPPTEKECIRSDACVTQTGYSETESGTKKVEYRKCGNMEKNLDSDGCKEETLDTLDVKTCFCQGELCNKPGSGSPVWVWIVIALVVVLIIGAVVALIIWKLKSRSGENSKEIPKTEPESVPLQEATKTDGEDQKSQEMPNDVP